MIQIIVIKIIITITSIVIIPVFANIVIYKLLYLHEQEVEI